MCLGVPGRVVERFERDGLPMGKVDFGGILKDTCLSYTPDVGVGQYVIVHVGFAISQLDEQEAQEVFSYLKAIGDLEDSGAEETPGEARP